MRTIAIAAALVLALFATAAEARPRHHHRSAGSCDGIHRCRCGTTAANKHGLPWLYNGYNLKRAVEWTRAFPRTSFQIGVVGYVRRGGPSGHVFTVTGGDSCRNALVYDDAGNYARNVCNARFMSVGRHEATAYPTSP